MAKDTKERILDAALEIFARDGYSGANIKDIAEAVGLVKSAFYRHFESKEELLNCLVEKATEYYDGHFGSPENLPEIPKSTDGFYELTMKMFDYTTHDRKIVLMRKIILTEQFRVESVKKLATKHFNTGLENIFTVIFEGMIENGIIKKEDPKMLAFAYISPISSLVHLVDREPDKINEATEKVKAFSKHFIKTYAVN